MIFWSLTATVAPGKEEEAEQWSKQFAQFVTGRFGTEIQLARRMDGPGGRYVWLETHDSLAAWEEQDKKFNADAEVRAKLKEGDGLFSNFETHFWQIL